VPDPNTTDQAVKELERFHDRLDQVPGAVDQLTGLVPLVQIIPVADILFGGTMLVVIGIVHASGINMISTHFSRRAKGLTTQPSRWRTELLLGYTIFLLLSLHLTEIVVWAAGLHYSGLLPNWRLAGLFAANNYTALGYGNILPLGWGMLAPIIAISGLFTFGWTGSVLVSMVGRYNQLRDQATGQG
jgi:hypothetical protein